VIEAQLTAGDRLPSAIGSLALSGDTSARELVRVRDNASDRHREFFYIADRDDHARVSGDLRDRSACVAGDDCAARLRLDNDTAELLDPCLRRPARHEHDVSLTIDRRQFWTLLPRSELDAVADAQRVRQF
jgi:hypothetical protein